MNLSILKSKIQKLPQNPGVYVFRGEKREILYVGKAANLKSRVSSYFRTDANLRKNANPKNITNRPIEVMIHEVADIEVQETDSVLEALILESNLIKKYQPKYNAMGKDDKSFCYFAITKEEWPRVLILRKTDLENKYNHVIPSLSRNLIDKKLDPSTPLRSAQDDIKIGEIFGPYISKKQMEIALKIMRKIFPFHSSSQKTEKGCLDYQIGTCPGPHAGEISRADYLKNIRGIRMILEGKKKNLVKKMEKEMREAAKKSEFEKAGEVRNKIFALKHIRDVALISMDSRPLTIDSSQMRIEAYDISNISGQHATGSMAVFKNDEPEKSQYRKFKIKTVTGIDDVGAMREVLLRRFNNDWPLPDLMLLDGGIGHLNMGAAVLESLGLKIPLAAVAKGPARKGAELRIMNYESGGETQDILNDKKLLKRIMNEAHRFAIGYHRKLCRKTLTTPE